MKKIVFISFFVTIILSCNNSDKSSDKKSSGDSSVSKETKNSGNENVTGDMGGRYGIKSARVVTVTSLPNNMGTSTMTLYFDHYGKESITETVSNYTMKGIPAQPKQYSMMQDGYQYSWDEGEKTGTKMKINILGNVANLDWEKMGKEMADQMKIKKAGNETFLGKNCEVYEMDNQQLGKGRILTWKNIPMLTDIISFGGIKVKSEVKELEENPSIDATKLKLPDEVQFKELQMPGKM